jgi:predicted DNA-binding antitoxin AbrB/MazE fold protein
MEVREGSRHELAALNPVPRCITVSNMSGGRHFRAVYENGLLRPLDELDVKEGEVVELIIPAASWEDDLEALLRERAALSGRYAEDEVERDVKDAVAEVRQQRDAS